MSDFHRFPLFGSFWVCLKIRYTKMEFSRGHNWRMIDEEIYGFVPRIRCSATTPRLRILCLGSKSHSVWGFYRHGHQVTSTILATKHRGLLGRAKVYFNAAGRLLATSRQTLLHCGQTGIEPANLVTFNTVDPSDPYLLDVYWCMFMLDLAGGIKDRPLSIPTLPWCIQKSRLKLGFGDICNRN